MSNIDVKAALEKLKKELKEMELERKLAMQRMEHLMASRLAQQLHITLDEAYQILNMPGTTRDNLTKNLSVNMNKKANPL
jgi:hypothetical protein